MSNLIIRNKRALTFLEIVISLSILSIILVAGTFVFQVALENVKKSNLELIATNLGRGLMAEIMTKRFDESTVMPWTQQASLGFDPGETRFGAGGPVFDDVDDYHGFSESPPIGIDNLAMDGSSGTPNYSNFRRTVAVVYVNANMTTAGSQTDYKRVTVTVQVQGIPDTVLVEVKAAN